MRLLDKTVAELLEKFGKGNHIPGSGSAAAFQGMVASKLILTVIAITADDKRRPAYDEFLTELLDFYERINKHIFPRLSELFQLDSDQFDNAILLRKARDSEKEDVALKNQLRREAQEQLKVSIDIPLEISALCIELSEMAAYVFDNGYHAVRGDSQVGLSAAVSGLSGCIAIVRLNVLSYGSDEYNYIKEVLEKVEKLDKDYQTLRTLNESKIDILREEFEQKIPLFDGVHIILDRYKGKLNIDIEACVRELQNLIWKNRHVIWKKNPPQKLLDILHPKAILRHCLGFDCFSTGRFAVPAEMGEIVEIGGVIDQDNKLVAVSNKFPKQVQRFTAAHELAHAILHKQSILHRDLPADCSGKRRTRDLHELQADEFASFFLMPRKQVKQLFFQIYSTYKFSLDDNSAFKFGGKSVKEIKLECKNLRGLSRKLANVTSFEGRSFLSLANTFDVSVEAMAIQLEDLGLVKY